MPRTLRAAILITFFVFLYATFRGPPAVLAGPIPIGINSFICAEGKILKRVGGVWACSDDAGAGGGSEPSSGDKGDITVVGGTAWTIDNDTITNAKAANMAASTIKGRITASTGDPEDLTATQVRTIINVAEGADVTTTGTQTLTNKTLTAPVIADFTNAPHAHVDTPSGGTIPYLPLTGGTLTGQLMTDNLGIAFEESDTNPACTAGDFAIYADLSEAKFKTCTNGVVADIGSGGGGGSGDVVGPASATDNAIARFDTTTGKLLQNSTITADDTGNVNAPGIIQAGSAFRFDTAGTAPTCEEGFTGIYWSSTDLMKCLNGVETTLDTDTDTDTGVLNLQGAYDGGKVMIGANSEANAVVICADITADGDCNDPTDIGWKLWGEPSQGAQLKAFPDGDYNITANDPYDISFRLGLTAVGRWDHTSKKMLYIGNGRPLKSVVVPGTEFGSCTYSEAVIAASKPKVGVFTCTDSSSDGFDFDFPSPLNWNADTVTVRLSAWSVAASPAGTLLLKCSGQAVTDGDVIANKATTGEQDVSISFTGSAQYKLEHATSNAITITSTPAAGDHLFMHCDVNATGTNITGGTIADVRIAAVAKVFYTVTGESE